MPNNTENQLPEPAATTPKAKTAIKKQPEPKQEMKKFSLSDLMNKTENTKSVWGQTKSVFNDTTEIISELAEGTSEAVKTLRKALNLANLQLDEMIIQQKIGIFTTLMESGFSDEQALSIIVTQIRN